MSIMIALWHEIGTTKSRSEEGGMDRIVSSQKSVKSKVRLPGSSKSGPKPSSTDAMVMFAM